MTATHVGSAWSCTVRLVVEDPRALAPATADLYALLDRVDAAASRFRADSALSIANARAGRPTPIPRLLVELVAAALEAARQTSGGVDPTVGLAMQRLGYDRDIADIADIGDAAGGPASLAANPSPGRWRSVKLHRGAGLLTVPVGSALDLGATAKAWTADRAAAELAARFETSLLVELGGDLAVAGERPGGWAVRVAERAGGPGQLVTLEQGGLCTSTTTIRTWRRGGRTVHHLVNPATGEPAAGQWRTASVAAGSALAANTASTAAIVRSADALVRLTAQGTAARLIAQDGAVVTTPGWPDDIAAAA